MLAWMLGLFGCAQSYTERMDAYRAELKPTVDAFEKLDRASLPKGELSLAKGRKVLFVEHEQPRFLTRYVNSEDLVPEAVASTAAEVGVIVWVTDHRRPEPTATYTNGARGYTHDFTFLAVAVPENVVVAQWTGVGVPAYETFGGAGTRDVEGYYGDEIRDAERLFAGKMPGTSDDADVLDTWRTTVQPLVTGLGEAPCTLPEAPAATVAGRKGVAAQDGRLMELTEPHFEDGHVRYTLPPLIAPDAASVGYVVWYRPIRLEPPSAEYTDGTVGYTTQLDACAVALPEKQVVARWSRILPPPDRTFSDLHPDKVVQGFQTVEVDQQDVATVGRGEVPASSAGPG